MPVLDCPFPDCTYSTPDIDYVAAGPTLTVHGLSHMPNAHANNGASKAPRIERPAVSLEISEEDWDGFTKMWAQFKRVTNLQNDEAAAQLFQCCSPELSAQLLKSEDKVLDKDEKELLDLMKAMAVIPVAVSVRRTDLLSLQQAQGENIKSFLAKVKGKAMTCGYTKKCPACDPVQMVDYTDEVIRDVLVHGLHDMEIRQEVLGLPKLNEMNIPELVGHIEGKEMARDAVSGSLAAAAAISTYARGQKSQNKDEPQYDKTGKCEDCNCVLKLYAKNRIGSYNKTPFKVCLVCFKKKKPKKKEEDSKKKDEDSKHRDEHAAIVFELGALEKTANNTKRNVIKFGGSEFTITANGSPRCPSRKSIELDHHIFKDGAWFRRDFSHHPILRLALNAKEEDYDTFGFTYPRVGTTFVDAVTDTGAQSCLWSRRDCLNAGFHKSDFIPVKHKMKAANGTPVTVDGAVIVRLSGLDSLGATRECNVIVYVSPDANGFYLSREALIQLGVISKNFPMVGEASHYRGAQIASSTVIPEPELDPRQEGDIVKLGEECTCLKRDDPPGKPAELPFKCSPENNVKMRDWLLNRYKGSTFNTCPHQLLPQMEGPPIELHVDPEAKPVAIHVPSPIPLHWQDKVKEGLLRDEALGVIERVPYGEPSQWCHRMVITQKENGDPRRTVDLSPLNKYCTRETHASSSPFHLARGVPANTWRTVTDAWNGFHSVPLLEKDKNLTTFITPIGRFRYLRAPQGFVSSKDGYDRRYDSVLQDFERKKKCTDDVLHYDELLLDHWWRTIELLELLGAAGIVLNPEKFQFAQKTVDFAGFRLGPTIVEPLPKYLDAIRNFPVPKNITDIRSWFGLVNQVSHYEQLRDIMAPYKPFLSHNARFEWTDELDGIFKESKKQIVDAIREGVEIFDVNLTTCVRPDWSTVGIGFYMLQKHCSCDSELPDCCEDGWRIVLAGSRFLRPAEQRYAPVEGEMLAVAWSLEQTRFFTLGSNRLIVVTDHQPLTKLLGDRTLDEIVNTRLFRLKQRTLQWRFQIFYMPGSGNYVGDATSRHPVSEPFEINAYAMAVSDELATVDDDAELAYMETVKTECENVKAITWERLKSETAKDEVLCTIMSFVESGFPTDRSEMPPASLNFWEYRNELFVYDDVLIKEDRVVIPANLQTEVLDNLHAAHQGCTSMFATAKDTVFWPGLTQGIEEKRSSCAACNRNAPSQAKLPPIEPVTPSSPFEAIVSDYFDFKGNHYLVIGDRLSGWTEPYQIKTGTKNSGAKGLVSALRKSFVTFGVPKELSSDGGPEFKAAETKHFLSRWGVRHRMSSAYNPQSNGRAELAVKATKRLLENNTGPGGSLDNDALVRALLIQRNTPDPTCKISPSEILFGRKLSDTLPRLDKGIMKFSNTMFRQDWREGWALKEDAMKVRYAKSIERLSEHSRQLPPLRDGTRVFVQNQTGPKPGKWDKSGQVVECKENDQYVVKVDGSGRLTLRNRRFLRSYEPDHGLILRKVITPAKPVNPPAMPVKTPEAKKTNPAVVTPPTYAEMAARSPNQSGAQSPQQMLPVTPRRSTMGSAARRISWSNVSPNKPVTPAVNVQESTPVINRQSPVTIPSPVCAKVPWALSRLDPFNNKGNQESLPDHRPGRTQTRSSSNNPV